MQHFGSGFKTNGWKASSGQSMTPPCNTLPRLEHPHSQLNKRHGSKKLGDTWWTSARPQTSRDLADLLGENVNPFPRLLQRRNQVPEHRHKVSGVPILKKLRHSKKRRREVKNLWSTIPGVTLLQNVHYCNYSNYFNKTHYIRIMVIISTIAIISIILLLLYFTSSCWQET